MRLTIQTTIPDTHTGITQVNRGYIRVLSEDMAGCEANPTLSLGAGEVVLMVEHVLSLHGLVMYSHVANCAGYLISHVGVLSTALSQLIPGCPFSVSSGG